ncbi:MAG: 2-isopropylmalate synthase [Verrucomicrobiales bacterium]|nr:2-isopropylmalate synthase [Verrucomicrobiales bacterium]
MKPESIRKYRPFPAVTLPDREWPDRTITKAPQWCSVDLRDGNQALPVPMNVEEKLRYFDLLVDIGFKQIEVGFPAAANTEFNFLRALVEQDRIPEDVTVQVLVQARNELIERTFESLEGVRHAIVHVYNSTSPLQRRVTFGDASKQKIKDIAVSGARYIKELVPSLPDSKIDLQYSPESFSDTELEYSLEVCNAVAEVWQPTEDIKIILNLPATVEWSTPNVHADQIEWFCRHVDNRENVIVSLHTHNDRGTGIAATELGLLAGADRVEGTLFGNGERTGNLDIVTVALNMNSHGIETGLDFSDLSNIRQTYEHCTRMTVPERQPYGGELVFTAFSGSHQDAIKKGLDRRKREVDESVEGEDLAWGVPYLTIDPRDIGRSYEAIIRINSQSGKGGVAYVLDQEHGFDLPKTMHPQVGQLISGVADELGRELLNGEISELFREHFVNIESPMMLDEFELDHATWDCAATVTVGDKTMSGKGTGNGPINSLVHCLEELGMKDFSVTDYRSHALRGGSDAESAAYVQISHDDRLTWGCGVDSSIELAGLKALISAWNISRS